MLIHQQLVAASQRGASQPALHQLGKDIAFSELPRKVSQLSYLYQNELGQRARVALLASNCAAVPLSFIALTNTRSTLIPLDPSWSMAELGKCLKESEATHLAVSADRVAQARELLRELRLSIPLVEIEKKTGGEYDGSFSAPPESPPKDTDVVLLLRTGGSSGQPRFAAFDHRALLYAVVSLRGCYRVAAGDRFMTPLNWSHPFAFVHGMLFPLLNAHTCVVDPGSEKKDLAKFLRDAKVTRMVASAVQARELLKSSKESGTRLATLKSITVGLDGVSRELEKLSDANRIPLARCYGQTENTWTVAMDDLSEIAHKPRPAPRALGGLKYKVLDANGDAIEGKGSRTGLLAVSGLSVMTGYRSGVQGSEAAEETDKATKSVLRGTWLYTGDIATLTGDGPELRVQVLGRKEQLIEKAGKWISPSPIDEAVAGIPGISAGAGFVTRDLKGKPILVCAVQKDENSSLRAADILEKLKAKLPSEQAPSVIAFVDSVPRSLAGVDRARLARQFAGVSAEAGEVRAASATAPGNAPAVTEAPDSAPGTGPSATEVSDLAPPGNLEVLPTPPPVPDPTLENAVFTTRDVISLTLDQPQPTTLYLCIRHQFVPILEEGKSITRETADNLLLRGVKQVFVRAG